MLSRLATALSAAAFTLLLSASAGAEEPWSDADPKDPPHRYALSSFGFRAGAEYRAQFIHVNPLALASESIRSATWLEHRLRLDAGADYLDKIRIVTSVDVLDGVLWGDSGTFGDDPSSNSGANANARNPNVTRPCVRAIPGADPLAADSYTFGVCKQNEITLRKLYGEVILPFGLLRVGRQPVNIGMGVQATDGDGRANRFGVARTGNIVDRILFATKPLEALKPASKRSSSPEEGLVIAIAYDRWVGDDPVRPSSAVNQWDTAFRFGMPKHALGGDLLIAGYHAYRWDGQFSTKVHSFGLRAMSRFGPLFAGFDVAANIGSTREIAEAYKVITNDPVVDQPIRQVGARGTLRLDQKYWSAYVEVDYASGDPDPQTRTPLSQFVFSEDTNVGLLLFKHVVSFQSARSAAAAVETLRRLGASTFPAESIATRGAFTNAFAIFPQFDVKPHPSVLLRLGVLAAWAPAKLVDPVASLTGRDGLTIQDDLVNFAGGKPGSYYGTELDGRIQWRFLNHFLFDLEGAVLFPGDALKNQDGAAVRSVLVQSRTTFFF